jgi:hypothetical protein
MRDGRLFFSFFLFFFFFSISFILVFCWFLRRHKLHYHVCHIAVGKRRYWWPCDRYPSSICSCIHFLNI